LLVVVLLAERPAWQTGRAQAKLPGPPPKGLTPAKPVWRPRSALAAGSLSLPRQETLTRVIAGKPTKGILGQFYSMPIWISDRSAPAVWPICRFGKKRSTGIKSNSHRFINRTYKEPDLLARNLFFLAECVDFKVGVWRRDTFCLHVENQGRIRRNGTLHTSGAVTVVHQLKPQTDGFVEAATTIQIMSAKDDKIECVDDQFPAFRFNGLRENPSPIGLHFAPPQFLPANDLAQQPGSQERH
jgi:hypothetical protein